jgi:hypothetical protein
MSKLLLASLVVALFAGGCRKATPEKACKHLKALATAQVDRDIAKLGRFNSGAMGAEIKQKAKDFDVEACAVNLEARGVDANCVADAATFTEAATCMRAAKD